jgi:hypothetical protein
MDPTVVGLAKSASENERVTLLPPAAFMKIPGELAPVVSMVATAPTAPSPSISRVNVVFAAVGPCTAGVLSAVVSMPAPGTRITTSASVDPVKSIGVVSGLAGWRHT